MKKEKIIEEVNREMEKHLNMDTYPFIQLALKKAIKKAITEKAKAIFNDFEKWDSRFGHDIIVCVCPYCSGYKKFKKKHLK